MKYLLKLWNWLDGKKTVIAEFYWFVSGTIIMIWFPDGLTGTPLKIQLSVGAFLTFLGLGHKALKKTIAGKPVEVVE